MTKVYLEPDEVELLEKAATNLRDRPLIKLLARLGHRIGPEPYLLPRVWCSCGGGGGRGEWDRTSGPIYNRLDILL